MTTAKSFSFVLVLISLSFFAQTSFLVTLETNNYSANNQNSKIASTTSNIHKINSVLQTISFPSILPALNTSTEPVIIAVIDSGINKSTISNYWVNKNEIPNNSIDDDHNGFVDDYYGWDFTQNKPSQFEGSFSDHGTFVSHIIYSMTKNISNIKIMDIRVFDSTNFNSNFDNFYDAINYALSFPAVKVIQFSIEFKKALLESYPQKLHWIFTKAYLRHVAIVTVSGNQGITPIADPGLWPETITVGSIDNISGKLVRSTYSDYGQDIDVSVPGSYIQGIGSSGKTTILSGTSFSAAFVGGALALFQTYNYAKNYSVDTIRKILQSSSKNLQDCQQFGAGLLNVTNLLYNAYSTNVSNLDYVCKPISTIPTSLAPLDSNKPLSFPTFPLLSLTIFFIYKKWIRKLKKTT